MHIMWALGNDITTGQCASVLHTLSGGRCACAAAHMGCVPDSHEVTQHSFRMYKGKASVTWGRARPAQSMCDRATWIRG